MEEDDDIDDDDDDNEDEIDKEIEEDEDDTVIDVTGIQLCRATVYLLSYIICVLPSY